MDPDQAHVEAAELLRLCSLGRRTCFGFHSDPWPSSGWPRVSSGWEERVAEGRQAPPCPSLGTKRPKGQIPFLYKSATAVWQRLLSPLAIICIPTMPLEPGGPLEGMAVLMLWIMRPGATVWPIIGPTLPPMGPCGPQPCCMGPRMDPFPSMSDPERKRTESGFKEMINF